MNSESRSLKENLKKKSGKFGKKNLTNLKKQDKNIFFILTKKTSLLRGFFFFMILIKIYILVRFGSNAF